MDPAMPVHPLTNAEIKRYLSMVKRGWRGTLPPGEQHRLIATLAVLVEESEGLAEELTALYEQRLANASRLKALTARVRARSRSPR